MIHLDFILGETISVLARRLEEHKRSTDFTKILAEIRFKIPLEKITWASMNSWRWYNNILSLIDQYKGELNFNDAFIAIQMQRSHISHLISFDKDFDQLLWVTRVYDASQIKGL